MPKISAGLLIYRKQGPDLQVFLVHPGGPFWAKKDEAAWSIPKGESEPNEDLLAAAKREFLEETGTSIDGDFMPLEPVRQPGGKIVYAWAIEGDLDPAAMLSNTFTLEWPPRSGRQQEFPEIDRAAWFSIDEAMQKILKGQQGLISQLLAKIS